MGRTMTINRTDEKGYMDTEEICVFMRSLFERLEDKWNVHLQQKSKFQHALYKQLIKSKDMKRFLENMIIYDRNTFVHSVNVAFYSLLISEKTTFSVKQQGEIGYGSLFHDIGKLLVPLEILNKEAGLLEWEFEKMKEHAQLGAVFLSKEKKSIPDYLIKIAEQHHERIDGCGYPYQLKGNEIHEYAKIISVADVFDAITTDRPYRKAMDKTVAFSIIEEGIGSQFERNYAEILLAAVSNQH